MEINLKMDGTLTTVQLIWQNALLWSLCEHLIPKDQWADFIKMYERRKRTAALDLLEAFPDQFQDGDELRKEMENQLKNL
jgi:hypothetical protein